MILHSTSTSLRLTLLLSFFPFSIHSLASIRKVAVVGAGIAGLTTAHCLDQHGIAYDIFDSRPNLDSKLGAGVQLNGGLSVLGKIDPTLRDAVYAAGLPQVGIESRSWSSEKNRRLFELNIPQLIQSSWSSDIRDSLVSEDRIWWVSIMRSTLQETLATGILSKIQYNKRLVGLETATAGTATSSLIFADGSTSGPYDLVIGCEGINSVVKTIVDSGGKAQQQRASALRSKTAIYSGIRIRYAVSSKYGADTSSTFTQHLGNGVYALDSMYGQGGKAQRCAFLVYLDPGRWGPFPRGGDSSIKESQQENAEWNPEQPDTLRSVMQQQLVDSGITDPTLQATIQEADQFLELGSYFHSPFGSWSAQLDGGGAHLVLCGDAAHALPPFLGQGANQAIQDAYCLVQALARYDKQQQQQDGDENLPANDLSVYLKDYERARWPTTFSILVKSVILGYLETGGFDGAFSKFRDLFFRTLYIVGVVPKILLGAAVPRV